MDKKITNDIIYIGVDDKDIDLFEGQFDVPNGMAYNSYVILDKKTAVMDTVDASKTDEWLENLENALEKLPEVSKRLNGVVIEHKDFENLIKVYDRTGALFYCDPPYHSTEKFYDMPFTEDDHRRLRDVLSGIKGRFLLSYNDDDFVRELYKDFKIIPVERNNNLSSGSFKEIIVKNY